jgi:predicted ATPase
VRVPGAKERALLADLVVQAGRVVAADRLVEDLWGPVPPGNPANRLAEFVRDKALLVVLDNCEHLVEGCAG